MTNEMKHTPEPWSTEYKERYPNDYYVEGMDIFHILLAGDQEIGRVEAYPEAVANHLSSQVGEANARRIVACVNACAEIPTEALQNGVIHELLACLESTIPIIRNSIDAGSDLLKEEKQQRLEAVQRVIAKAKGE